MADDRRVASRRRGACAAPRTCASNAIPLSPTWWYCPRYKNTLTPAMYFGIRHAVEHVNRSSELAGLLLSADGETFITGGDLGDARSTTAGRSCGELGMDLLPFDAVRRSNKPVVVAVNGLCQGSHGRPPGRRGGGRASGPPSAPPNCTAASPTPTTPRSCPGRSGRPRHETCCSPAGGSTPPRRSTGDWFHNCSPHDALLEAATEALTECCYTAPSARAAVDDRFDAYYGDFDRAAMEESLAGPERQEGWAAFSERRAPVWIPEEIRPTGRI